MAKPKERITITMDPVLLERIDAVAESRGDSRSAVIERVLEGEIEQKRGRESFFDEVRPNGAECGNARR